ncbi:MAG: DUF4838 domain-containing protein [Clostridia bacterium]|nr:DUF4838 domain-containing protein [Clostridia bacterium]
MKVLIIANKGRFTSIKEAAFAEKEIDWWDDSNTDRTVCMECYAAIELSEHLSLCGCSVNLRDRCDFADGDRCDTKNDALIYIGKAFANSEDNGGRDGCFRCRQHGENFIINIWGQSGIESLYATYQFLDNLGFKWYLPDEKGNIIPESISLKELNVDIEYDFRTRACYNEFIDDENPGFLLWASRNRMNMLRVNKFKNPHIVKKLGLAIMGGGHEIFYRYLNPSTVPNEKSGKTYFEMHPDWFALIDGVRSNKNENLRAAEGYYTGDNICTSNENGIATLAQNMIEAFNIGDYRHLEYLNLWAYDNGRWCQCEECKRIGNLSRRMLMLAYEINKIFVSAYKEGILKRRIKFVVPVYHETLQPPDKPLPDDFDYEYIIATFFPIERCYAHNINDSICTESNSLLIKDYDGWNSKNGSNYKGELFIGEYFNVSSFASLPFLFCKLIANDIPFYYNTGTRHLYYMHISARKWGMLALTNNLLALLMRDRCADGQAYLDEMHELLYPNTKEIMIEFHKILEKASVNSKYLKHYQFSKDGEKSSLIANITRDDKFPLSHCKFDYRDDSPESSISFIETMELFEEAKILINKAADYSSGAEGKRVEDELMRFEYGYKVMLFIFNYLQLRVAYNGKNHNNVKRFLKITENLRKELVEIREPLEEMKYECPFYLNAFEATWHSKTYEELKVKIEQDQ